MLLDPATIDRARIACFALLDSAEVAVKAQQDAQESSLQVQQAMLGAARSYLAAINALLDGHGPLYNELIEHPRLMLLRRFCRRAA